jgi:hypothetical protein
MYGINPYAQAGWYNPANPSSINERRGPTTSSQPPTFGALPYPDAPSPSTKRFIFTSQGRSIVRCCDVVDGETCLTAYKIKMAQDGHEYTSLQRPNGTPVGYIVWKPQGPEVELYNVVTKQKGKDWLPLSPDQRYDDKQPSIAVSNSRFRTQLSLHAIPRETLHLAVRPRCHVCE